jgi:DNA-binding Lrp family transcriptional regulator
MPSAFILTSVAKGAVEDAIDDLSEFDHVTEVYSIAGRYDLLIKVQVEEYEQFTDVIPEKLQSVEAIEETETLMAFKTYKF